MNKLRMLLVAVVLSGCATGMSYHAWDSTFQLGYTDTQLSEQVYRVSYAGYNIPQSQCDDYAILRAAEIARGKGYKFFRVVNENQSLQTQAFYLPGTTRTTGTITTYGNVGRVNAVSQSSGFMATAQRPVSTFTIELLKDNGGQAGAGAVDAEIAWNSLSKKHGLSR